MKNQQSPQNHIISKSILYDSEKSEECVFMIRKIHFLDIRVISTRSRQWNEENPFTFQEIEEISGDLQIFSHRMREHEVWNFNPFFIQQQIEEKFEILSLSDNDELRKLRRIRKIFAISRTCEKPEIESFFDSFENLTSAAGNVIKTKIINNNISSMWMCWKCYVNLFEDFDSTRFHNRQLRDDFSDISPSSSIPFSHVKVCDEIAVARKFNKVSSCCCVYENLGKSPNILWHCIVSLSYVRSNDNNMMTMFVEWNEIPSYWRPKYDKIWLFMTKATWEANLKAESFFSVHFMYIRLLLLLREISAFLFRHISIRDSKQQQQKYETCRTYIKRN